MLKLSVCGEDCEVKAFAEGAEMATLVYAGEYVQGDRVVFRTDTPGFFTVQLEDTLPPAIVYVDQGAEFVIPFGEADRMSYSPRAFWGPRHVYTVKKTAPELVYARRNLAFNPYDQNENKTMYPHASANAQTRGEALFAPRNAIDGLYNNECHYPYPYQSWGINRDPRAALTVHFGVPVRLDEVALTLRCDFPHDSYWTAATLVFSDGSAEKLSLTKDRRPQHFSFLGRVVTSVTLQELVKHEDESPFPALTQFEAFGTVADN